MLSTFIKNLNCRQYNLNEIYNIKKSYIIKNTLAQVKLPYLFKMFTNKKLPINIIVTNQLIHLNNDLGISKNNFNLQFIYLNIEFYLLQTKIQR